MVEQGKRPLYLHKSNPSFPLGLEAIAQRWRYAGGGERLASGRKNVTPTLRHHRIVIH